MGKVASVERMVFRAGPYRGNVPAPIVEAESQPSGLYIEDLAGTDAKTPASVLFD
jgi:hypothetical protein